ncbi:MAG: hypothetical protein KC657_34940 [Myxococcales bacterium]|nr:hypothetical protein [Myxococcales bacterium]
MNGRLATWSSLAALAALAACSSSDTLAEADAPPWSPPPESCAPQESLETFAACSTGSGSFGRWTTDGFGMPAYDYGLDQHADARAAWTDSRGDERRDHWFAFGNARVNAIASNDGTVEVTTQDRGVTYLNKVDESTRAYGGGFSWLDDGERAWATAYKWRPRGARVTRRFGIAYAETVMEHAGVRTTRRTFAPDGDAPYVIDEVTIDNLRQTRASLRHYEYWDVARRPIEINWLVSGKAFKSAPRDAEARRDGRNALFDERPTFDATAQVLGLRRTHAAGVTPPPREAPDAVDHYPGDPFLAALSGGAPSATYTDKDAFFGEGDAALPRAVAERRSSDATGPARSGNGQPHVLVMRTDVDLEPGASRTLRFAYGATEMGAPYPDLDAARTDPAPLSTAVGALRPHLFRYLAEGQPHMHRELAWHTAQLEASVGYREYWGQHVVPQGSAYLYLHGADGALRDTALFAMPLAYTHPELAREQLLLAMGLAFADDSRFSYAFQGHGKLDDALGLHARPSDLDLFFLLAVTEYLGATGDVTLLDERVSYWPRSAANEATGYEHVRRAADHLLHGVGLGEHGLFRIGTGDWSDGIVVGSPDRALAMERGESIPNSQMALVVLPAVADLLAARDPALAAEIRALLPSLRAAVESTWTGDHYGRAYFGDGVLHGARGVDLEAQVWALIDRDLPAERRAALVASVRKSLDEPSAVGATLTPRGQMWPAVSQLLTWGYTRTPGATAMDHLGRASLAARAKAHPDKWFHIWSGPDGADASDGDTWASPVTPMTDFPTMNNNVHAMAVLAAVRVAGVEATSTGLRVAPPSTAALGLASATLDLDLGAARLRGVWRPRPGVARTLELQAPAGTRIEGVRVDGAAREVAAGAASVSLPVTAGPRGVAFEVDLRPE